MVLPQSDVSDFIDSTREGSLNLSEEWMGLDGWEVHGVEGEETEIGM